MATKSEQTDRMGQVPIPSDRQVNFKLYKSGAYAVSMYDAKSKTGALVEHDGKQALHIVRLLAESWEETVIKRRAAPGGPSISTSKLTGDANGNLEWVWQLDRPHLKRTEHWKIPVRGKGLWTQKDERPKRVTTYKSLGKGKYHGAVHDLKGRVRWTTEWTRSANGSWKGIYKNAHGSVAGTVEMSGGGSTGKSPQAQWDGPISRGSMGASGDDAKGIIKANVSTDDGGNKTYTWDEGSGHSVQVGSNQSDSWVTITVPGGDDGSSKSVTFGTEISPNGTAEDYTINTTDNADGSSSFTRVDTNSSTGDKGTTFGGTDTEGNSSYSERIEHSDGSVTIVIRTVDNNGDGTEEVIQVDAQGNVINEQTTEVHGQGSSGTSSGQSGSSSPGGGDDDNTDETNVDPQLDPNDPGGPDQPDAPDGGGDSGGGMPSDDGTDDRAPDRPTGRLGHHHSGVLSNLMDLARDGEAEPDGAENPISRYGQWHMQLGDVVQDGGGDDTGWGDGGGEGDGGGSQGGGGSSGGSGHSHRPMVMGHYTAPSGDDTGWGDFENPRAMVGYLLALVGASSVTGKSANLFKGVSLQREV